jgi:hypothetical protein
MELLQELKDAPSTFGKLADKILGKLISIAHQYGAERIDFVPDRYPVQSIKGGERDRRAFIGKSKDKDFR